MPLAPYRDDTSFQNVDLSNPINWDHPLNRGLVGWWLALPQWSGGTKWYDLCGKYDGTLMSGPSWSRRSTPDGTEGLSFSSAGGNYVTIPAPIPSGAGTVAFWAQATSGSTEYPSWVNNTGTSYQLEFGPQGNGSNRIFFKANGYFAGAIRKLGTERGITTPSRPTARRLASTLMADTGKR